MANYVLAFEGRRCPDGVKLVQIKRTDPKTGKTRSEGGIRFASRKRETYRFRLDAPDDLVVTDLMNAFDLGRKPGRLLNETEISRACAFVERYGYFWVHQDSQYKNENERGVPFSTFFEVATLLRQVWDLVEQEKYKQAAKRLNRLMSADTDRIASRSLSPEIIIRDGSPVLTLRILELFNFLTMETALVVTGGGAVKHCGYCGTIFNTGPGTGRRDTAMYCSNRCRVAAQREAKKPNSRKRQRSRKEKR